MPANGMYDGIELPTDARIQTDETGSITVEPKLQQQVLYGI